jgi:hypothetical protein
MNLENLVSNVPKPWLTLKAYSCEVETDLKGANLKCEGASESRLVVIKQDPVIPRPEPGFTLLTSDPADERIQVNTAGRGTDVIAYLGDIPAPVGPPSAIQSDIGNCSVECDNDANILATVGGEARLRLAPNKTLLASQTTRNALSMSEEKSGDSILATQNGVTRFSINSSQSFLTGPVGFGGGALVVEDGWLEVQHSGDTYLHCDFVGNAVSIPKPLWVDGYPVLTSITVQGTQVNLSGTVPQQLNSDLASSRSWTVPANHMRVDEVYCITIAGTFGFITAPQRVRWQILANGNSIIDTGYLVCANSPSTFQTEIRFNLRPGNATWSSSANRFDNNLNMTSQLGILNPAIGNFFAVYGNLRDANADIMHIERISFSRVA